MDISINGARVLATIENVPILGTVQISQTLVVAYLIMAIVTGLCIWLGSGLTVTGPPILLYGDRPLEIGL